MRRFVGKPRFLGCLAVATLFVGVVLGLLPRAGESLAEVVLIRDGSTVPNPFMREKFTSLGVDVLETYGTLVLAAVTSEQRRSLEADGFEVADVPQRTLTGRGAFFFDSKDGEPLILENLRADPLQNAEYGYYLVQFIGPVKGLWLEELKATGAEVFDYVPTSSFITAMDAESLQRVQGLPFVGWVGAYHPAYKISPPLLTEAEFLRTVVISLFPGRSPDRVEETIASSGGKVLRRWEQGRAFWFQAEVPVADIVDVAAFPEVAWIEESLPIALSNADATWVVQSNTGTPEPNRVIHDKGLHGEGQLIAVADGGPAYTVHETLLDPEGDPPGNAHRKVQAIFDVLSSSYNNSHGTGVAGIIAGDAPDTQGAYGTWNRQDGHAFAARLILQNLTGGVGGVGTPSENEISCCGCQLSEEECNEQPLFSSCCACDPPPEGCGLICCGMYQEAYAVGARIQANGVGAGPGSNPYNYCERARRNDEFVWVKLHETPPGHFFVTSPAGNDSPGGEIGRIKCEAQAKNVITVGASKNGTNAHDMLTGSSHGPAADGRLRPLVTAPGEQICMPHTAPVTGSCAGFSLPYRRNDGTSFAHPAVAGSAALVRQYFTEGWYPSGIRFGSPGIDPSAALIRALLINGAVDMPGESARGESVVDASALTNHSIPYALRARKTQNLLAPARATSEEIAIDYAQSYKLEMWFFVPSTGSVGKMLIADDGRVYAGLDPSGSSGVNLNVVGGNGAGTATVTRGQWQRLVITYIPLEGTFQATLGTQNLGTFTFRSEYLGRISMGTDASVTSAVHGEVFIDDICYLEFPTNAELWCENFNTGLPASWTLTTTIDETAYPNNIQGWGRIHLDNSLYFAGDALKLRVFDEMPGFQATGEEQEYRIAVPNLGQPFEVTLAWSDYPGTVGTGRALVNNLDLVVRDPGCTEYKGNRFSGGQSVSGGINDYLNAEEGVRRQDPAVGVWTVFVRASDIIYGPQPFALVATGGTGAVMSAPPRVTAADDHHMGICTVVSGTCVQTRTSDDVRHVLEEVSQGGVSRLEHVWRIDDVPLGSCITLNVEGYRPANSDGDDFKFSWSETLNGTYTDIPNAVIKKAFEIQGGNNYPFARSATSGPIYIKVSDTNQVSGGSLDRVYVDRLEIR